MTARERFETMLEERYSIDNPDEIIEAVSDFLKEEADRIEEAEPYATNTIKRYRDAADIVYFMLED